MSNPIKVVWCVDSPGWGGAELALLRVVKMTSSESCCVLHSHHASPMLLESLHRQRVQTRAVFSGGNTLRNLFRSLQRARLLICGYPTALFVVWCHHLDSNRWLQFGLALFGAKFILAERLIPANGDALASSRLTRPVKQFVARRALAVVVNGHSQLDHYATLFSLSPARLQVISNSRPVRSLRVRAARLRQDRNSLCGELGIRNDATVITCVGRLTVQKGQSTLIRAFATLVPYYPQLQLVLVGEGDLQSELELQAQSLPAGAIKFATYTQDVLPYLAVTDIFTLPSVAEGLSGALIEAMAACLPCVATDIPGNRELVQHGQTGLLVPPENPAALAAALRTLLENPAEARRLAAAGYAHVLQHYDEANEVLQWRNLFGEIAGQHDTERANEFQNPAG